MFDMLELDKTCVKVVFFLKNLDIWFTFFGNLARIEGGREKM